ncbi:hypothetical protein Clacol_002551 [Clathrus columnatus]|uniref:Uncharacterized protein n=1 Tax=Clathrus columnatus TaxID=1419009 RepID=A0AAV5A260_9AGAM|nr:hypothetical protein Clacol_002551 [Clathrus columnatus]
MPDSLDIEVPPRGGSIPSEDQFASTKIYPLIHTIKQDVIVGRLQLTASDINFTIVRPLVIKYGRLRNLALIYACLIVRSHFRRLVEDDLAHASLNYSRSLMCELLAIKCLRLYAANYFELVAVLTHSWNPLAGAPYESVCLIKKSLAIRKSEDIDILSSALEMAVSTDSKRFISAPLTQAVVNDIYSGRIIFTTISKNSLVADNYKQRQIEIYNCRKAPVLDHYSSFHVKDMERFRRWWSSLAFDVLMSLCLGNTSLTFQQASSFHPFFNAIEEFAISTIEGVKSEALFSYQPPFNLLAYAILAPLSWFVSPRKLHTANVFLIRVTSFPVLLIIAAYERHVAPASGSTLRWRSTKVAKYLAHRLPRKSATLIEAIVATLPPDGISLTEEEVPDSTVQSADIFRNSKNLDLLATGVRDVQSNPAAVTTPQHKRTKSDLEQHGNEAFRDFQKTDESVSSSIVTPSRRSLAGSLSLRPVPPTSIGTETQQEPSVITPLAKLYSRRPVSIIDRSMAIPGEEIEDLSNKITKLEHMLYQLNMQPIGNLTEEIKELHQRQARIENLLLTLTRGMRGEAGTSMTRSGSL